MSWQERFGWLSWWTAFATFLTVGFAFAMCAAESNGVHVFISSYAIWPMVIVEIFLFVASIISFAIASENRL